MDKFRALLRGVICCAVPSIVSWNDADPAFADYQILRSTLLKWERGLTLSPDATLDLKSGEELDLLDLAEGQTLVVRGPYVGTLADYVSERNASSNEQKQIETTGASRFVNGVEDSDSTIAPKLIEDRAPQVE